MKMKNVLSAALTGALMLSLFAGCSGGSGSSPSPSASASPEASQQPEATTIQVAALESGYGADMWREVADAFTAQTGIQVQLTSPWIRSWRMSSVPLCRAANSLT